MPPPRPMVWGQLYSQKGSTPLMESAPFSPGSWRGWPDCPPKA